MKRFVLPCVLAVSFMTPVLAQSQAPAKTVVPNTAIKVKPAASAAVVVAQLPQPTASSDVWVNGHVYHCPGSKFYGKTKKGSFMSEEAAQQAGAKVAHGRPCISK